MRLPSPSYREYGEFVAAGLVTIAVLQYAGIFVSSGEIDTTYLVVLGLTLPVSVYLLTVACENVTWVPRWDRMVRDET